MIVYVYSARCSTNEAEFVGHSSKHPEDLKVCDIDCDQIQVDAQTYGKDSITITLLDETEDQDEIEALLYNYSIILKPRYGTSSL